MKNKLLVAISIMLTITISTGTIFADTTQSALDGKVVTEQSIDAIEAAENPTKINTSSEDDPDEPKEEPKQIKTNVTGIVSKWSKKASSTIKDTITISPSNGRQVQLQMYDSKKKVWVRYKTFIGSNADKSNVSIAYPSQWAKIQRSKWRIHIPETKEATAYTSQTITVVTKNRKTLNLSAKTAVIMDASTGDILYDKSMSTKRYNASTTKIMTAILALENSKMSKKVRISRNASRTPYRSIWYKRGDKVYMRNLFNSILVKSDNGSAVAIGESISGSTSKFAKKMNRRAKDLGCKNTHFVNPHGLPNKKHYSTGYDLALMTKHALKEKYFREVIKKKSYSFKTLKKKSKVRIRTTNKLLGKVKGVRGGKTGTTRAAGYCYVGTYKYDGKTYITVVLGSKKDKYRWSDTKKLISYIKKYE